MQGSAPALHYHSIPDWENAIGGIVGKQFRSSLNSEELLKQFVKVYWFEANALEYSYEIYFKTGHPKLAPALLKNLSSDQLNTFQELYLKPDHTDNIL